MYSTSYRLIRALHGLVRVVYLDLGNCEQYDQFCCNCSSMDRLAIGYNHVQCVQCLLKMLNRLKNMFYLGFRMRFFIIYYNHHCIGSIDQRLLCIPVQSGPFDYICSTFHGCGRSRVHGHRHRGYSSCWSNCLLRKKIMRNESMVIRFFPLLLKLKWNHSTKTKVKQGNQIPL